MGALPLRGLKKPPEFRRFFVDEHGGGCRIKCVGAAGYNAQYLRRLLRTGKSEIQDGRALVIDIGGFTTDWIAVNPGGEVDHSLARSVSLGIQNVVADFEASFRANNLQAVKDTPVLPPERVRRAITSGVYEGAGRRIPCEKEANETTTLLLSRSEETYKQTAGRALGWYELTDVNTKQIEQIIQEAERRRGTNNSTLMASRGRAISMRFLREELLICIWVLIFCKYAIYYG